MINTIIGLAIAGAIGYILYKMYTAGKESLTDIIDMAEKKLDVNEDGKININDLKAEVKVIEDKAVEAVAEIKAKVKPIKDKAVSKGAAAAAKVKAEIDAIDSKVVDEIKKVKK